MKPREQLTMERGLLILRVMYEHKPWHQRGTMWQPRRQGEINGNQLPTHTDIKTIFHQLSTMLW